MSNKQKRSEEKKKDERAIGAIEKGVLRQIIGNHNLLSKDQMTIINAHYYKGLSIAKIADLLRADKKKIAEVLLVAERTLFSNSEDAVKYIQKHKQKNIKNNFNPTV